MPDFSITIGIAFVTFLAGVILSQKIKDWVQGVPGELRSHLNDLEASVKAQVRSAQAHVVADVKAKVLPATPVLATSASPAVTAAVTNPHAA